MYQAKAQGRNNVQFFSREMNTRAVERQVIESHLRMALERNELAVYFQPKVRLDSGTVCGAEALIRWNHPAWGLTGPLRFIRIAEESGLIVPIGRWVLHETCMQLRRWRDLGMAPGQVSVNVSSTEFRHPDFIDGVRAVLEETRLAPGDLQMEITESVLMRDTAESARVMKSLKEMGIELAVDDFGTGYSSLSYLIQFPIDVLKIDQSFVQKIGEREHNGVIVSALLAMASKLHYRVTAEGVERESQRRFLCEHHCDEGQGFMFGTPLPADQITPLLRGRV
jgi:EAL domain-containing protein (putative c-di-GMP-specific phosphodiesterase class I)